MRRLNQYRAELILFSEHGYFRLFEVILNRNGSINVGVVNEDKRAVVRTFVGNFSDGYRHFFVARFGAHQATAVTVSAVYPKFVGHAHRKTAS